jgi:hypothetical protein
MVSMAQQDEGPGWKSSTRGEQTWKEALERIASRNADTRRSGQQERQAHERGRENARQQAAARRRADLQRRRTP